MSRPIRLRDIAAHLGVSVSTVSLALREAPQIADETRERVLDAAQLLGYVQRPRQAAQHEVARLAFLSRLEPDNVFYAAVLGGAEAECRHYGIALDYARIGENNGPSRLAEADGLLVVGSIAPTAIARLREHGLPLVLVDNNLPTLGLDRVLTENVGGVERVVERLHSLGHRRIAFLHVTLPFPSFRDRLYGYERAMQTHELPCITLHSPSVRMDDVAQTVAGHLTSRDAPFSALIAVNDLAAISALHALQDCGLQVPDDVALVGFDDIDMAAMIRPSLTTCHVHRELMGALGVRQLLERIANPHAPPQALVLDVTIVERGSTGGQRPH